MEKIDRVKITIKYQYQNEMLNKISKLMSGMDLGIDSLWISDEVSYITTTEVDKAYIDKMVKHMESYGKGEGSQLKVVGIFQTRNLN
jgi:hypothetical protein